MANLKRLFPTHGSPHARACPFLFLPHRNAEFVAVIRRMSKSFLITPLPLNLPLPKTAQGCTCPAWFEVLTFFSQSDDGSSHFKKPSLNQN